MKCHGVSGGPKKCFFGVVEVNSGNPVARKIVWHVGRFREPVYAVKE